MDNLDSNPFSGVKTLTEEQRLSIANPEEGLIIIQEDGDKGIYGFHLKEWVKYSKLDIVNFRRFLEIGYLCEKTIATNKSIIQKQIEQTEQTLDLLISLKELSRVSSNLIKNSVTGNNKFEIILTVCLILMKALGAITLPWIYVFLPLIIATAFYLAYPVLAKIIGYLFKFRR